MLDTMLFRQAPPTSPGHNPDKAQILKRITTYYEQHDLQEPLDWEKVFSKSFLSGDWGALRRAVEHHDQGDFGDNFLKHLEGAFSPPKFSQHMENVVYCWIVPVQTKALVARSEKVQGIFPKWAATARLFLKNTAQGGGISYCVYVGQSDKSGHFRMMQSTAMAARTDKLSQAKSFHSALLYNASYESRKERRDAIRRGVRVFALGRSSKPWVLDALETVFISLLSNLNTALGGKLVRFKGREPLLKLLEGLPDLSDSSMFADWSVMDRQLSLTRNLSQSHFSAMRLLSNII